MRSYGQKSIKNSTKKATQQAAESRDAILWDIQLSDRCCRCKVQGSNEYVVARFPQNWSEVPSWCKPGQAVRIAHRGGVRGYIEVVGYGRAIPTPVSGRTTPDQATPENAILSGMEIKQIPQGSHMMVYVRTGSVRFAGVEKTVPAVSVANGGSLIAADMGLLFGSVAGIFEISAPASGYFRYDAFSLGADLVVYKTTGSVFATTESKPSIPDGNILIGYLLVRGGQTTITADDVAQVWSAPVASRISVAAVDNGSAWTITANVLDQWGAAIATTGGWTVAASIDSGDGSLDAASKNTGAGASAVFTYTEGTAGSAVLVRLSVDQGDVDLDTYLAIQL